MSEKSTQHEETYTSSVDFRVQRYEDFLEYARKILKIREKRAGACVCRRKNVILQAE